MEDVRQPDQKCLTKVGSGRVDVDNRVNFRLDLPDFLEYRKELEKGDFRGCRTETGYWKELFRLKKAFDSEHKARAREVVELLKKYALQPKDLIEAGLEWHEWLKK